MGAALKLASASMLAAVVFMPSVSAKTRWLQDNKLSRAAERQNSKDWALAVCVAKIAGSSELSEDANKTASGFLERGSLPVESYQRFAGLADTFIARTYGGSAGGRYDMKKCIDFYHSPELDALVASEMRR